MEVGLTEIHDVFNKYDCTQDTIDNTQLYHTTFNKIRTEPVTVVIITNSTAQLNSLQEYFVNGKVLLISEEIENSDKLTVEELEKVDVVIDGTYDSDEKKLNYIKEIYKHVSDGGYYLVENIDKESELKIYPGLIGCACNYNNYFFVGLENISCLIQKYNNDSKREKY